MPDCIVLQGLSAEKRAAYEKAGVLEAAPRDPTARSSHELRLAVINKAEALGFSFDEVVLLLRYDAGPRRANRNA